jgi:phosphatidylserine decarboxylase
MMGKAFSEELHLVLIPSSYNLVCMVRDGIFYALGMLLVAAFLWWLAPHAFALLPMLLAVFFLWFFRDPERVIPTEAGLVVSPADGKVTDVSTTYIDGSPYTRISIFLNVFDVHVNRSPITGVIKSAVYKRGKFLNAMDATSAQANEQNVVTVEGDGLTVVFKQIAGLLARRIVFNHKPGDALVRGQRVGLIKFGSRTDVIMPQSSELMVQAGDRVKGGSSVLARVPVPQKAAPLPAREGTGAFR